MAAGACKGLSMSQLRKSCYTYNHVYNNLIHDVEAYNNGGQHIYTDDASCKNTLENNLLVGAPSKGSYLYHHCGLDNISKNNIIHR